MHPEYFKSFQIGKLYYKYIKNTVLAPAGWTAEKLAHELENHGFIKLIENKTRYVELAGKQLSCRDLVRMFKASKKIKPYSRLDKVKHKLCTILFGALLMTGCASMEPNYRPGPYASDPRINALNFLNSQWTGPNAYDPHVRGPAGQPALQTPMCQVNYLWVPCNTVFNR